MSSGLIDIERAKRNIQSITDNSQDALLSVLIGACSDAIQKYCRREFTLRVWDELYNGNGDRRLLLREYPIQSVESVRYRPVTVINVQQADIATNQRAYVQVTSTGLKLVRVASGVTINDTSITWANNPTLQAVVNAVVALGNGWTAQVVGQADGDYGLWPSADLYVPPSYGDGTQSQGGLTCRGNNAELKLHTYELQGYQWDARGWLLRAIPYTDPELMHPEDLVWPVGINNFRVQYTAGYSTIPEAVQEACALWVAERYYETTRDPSVVHTVGTTDTGYENPYGSGVIPAKVRALLLPFRRHTIATDQS